MNGSGSYVRPHLEVRPCLAPATSALQPTSHYYKKNPPLAGTEDTPQELHYCPLLYLRVGSSVVWS
jgi:hypothetical protein